MNAALTWLGIGVVCTLATGWLLSRLLTTRQQAQARRRQQHALVGERAAEGLLEAHGYQVLERQVRADWQILVDGEPVPVELRADYLVRRAGHDFVAEVKTGKSAPSPRTASTRRQLLEYGLAYPVTGTLLVDMETEHIHEVHFPGPNRPRAGPTSWRGWRGRALSALCWAFVGAGLTGVLMR